MKKVFLLLLAVLSAAPGMSQTRPGTDVMFYQKPVGLQIPAFDSRGYNPLFPETPTNLSDQNPAAISGFTSGHYGISWRLFTNLRPDDDADKFTQSQAFLPASAGFIYPVNSFTAAFGYSQKYNFRSITEFENATLENPEGTGEKITREENEIHHQVTVSGAWQKKNFIQSGDQFSAGIHLAFNKLFLKKEFGEIKAESFPAGWSWAAGVQYGVTLENEISVKGGLFFEKGSDLDGKVKYSGNQVVNLSARSGDSTSTPLVQINSSPLTADFPDRLHAGINLKTPGNYTLSVQFSYIWMEQTWKTTKNQLNFAGNAGVPVSETIHLTAGFYSDTQQDDYPSFFYSFYNLKHSDYRSFFLTAGLNFAYQAFLVDLAFADNRISSGKIRTQTQFKAGISYQF